ncbi:MAG: nucleoside triphosphate pyrophosphohydrolase [Bacteroidaceae bacterium]|nr:nucleoside triphosphate pyrophosphohydrolase [Bacteroidaceae bacterium]
MMHSRSEILASFERFLDVLDELREKCPWDRKQTNESLRPNTIEEVYELSDALVADDTQNICKELGDVLLHVAFYAKIAQEREQFDMKDVCDRLCEKLIYRHPHVFGTAKAETAGEVCKNWEQLKRTEKDGNKSLLSGVPTSMPSLIKAFRMQEKAANIGFDWDKKEDVWAKVQEELVELQTEMNKGDKENMQKEFGDFLFSLVNAARLYDINPDTALELTNRKFRNRFGYVEECSKQQGRNLQDMTLAEMDSLWNKAKAKGL